MLSRMKKMLLFEFYYDGRIWSTFSVLALDEAIPEEQLEEFLLSSSDLSGELFQSYKLQYSSLSLPQLGLTWLSMCQSGARNLPPYWDTSLSHHGSIQEDIFPRTGWTSYLLENALNTGLCSPSLNLSAFFRMPFWHVQVGGSCSIILRWQKAILSLEPFPPGPF